MFNYSDTSISTSSSNLITQPSSTQSSNFTNIISFNFLFATNFQI
jgi:hypothetical protein